MVESGDDSSGASRRLRRARDQVKKILTQHKQINQEDNYHEGWKISDWKDIALVIAIFGILYDYERDHELFALAKRAGGLWVIGAYLLLSLFIQLPLLILYEHVGDFTRAATCRAFAVYGSIFRFVGISMFISSCFYTGLQASIVGPRWTYLQNRDYEDIVSCQKITDNRYPWSDKCCVSIYDRLNCKKKDQFAPWCQEMLISKRKLKPVRSDCWQQSAPKKSIETFGDEYYPRSHLPGMEFTEWAGTAVIGFVLIPAVAAFLLPSIVFVILIAAVGVVGVAMFSISHTWMMVDGDMPLGFARLWKLTDFSKFFSSLEPIGSVCYLILAASSKFSVIFLASMTSPKKRVYWPMVIVYFAHIFVLLYTISCVFAAWGGLEAASREAAVISSTADVPSSSFATHILTEFFMVCSSSGWLYVFNYSINLLHLARFAAPFLECVAFYYYKDRAWQRQMAMILFATSLTLLPVMLDFYSGHLTTMPGKPLVQTMNALWVLLSLFVMMVYGPAQHIYDVSTHYPLRENIWFGPTSKFYVYAEKVTNVFGVTIFPIAARELVNVYRQLDEVDDPILPKSSVWLLLGCQAIVIVVCLVWDLLLPLIKEEALYRLIYPQKGHPAFMRLVGNWEAEQTRKQLAMEETVRFGKENERLLSSKLEMLPLPLDRTQSSPQKTGEGNKKTN